VQGGMTIGRTTTDSCYANALPQLDLAPSSLPGSVAGSILPRADGYCDVTPPWSSGTQVKFVGSYVLPWQLRTSATYQNTAGPEITAQIAVPNAQVAPSLGRDLSAGTNSTVTVDLIRPRTMFEKRINQVDWRMSKQFLIARYRVQAQFDVYNAFNSSAITGLNTRYGSQWLRPTSILPGRVLKFGTQIEF
jgi:outer membrane receptor protein involved in Fe transport